MTEQTVIEPTLPTPPEPTASKCAGKRKLACITMSLVIVALIGAVAFSYVEIIRLHNSLKNTRLAVKQNSESVNGLGETVTILQSGLAKAQDLSAQQEQLVTEWQNAQKGDLDKWRLAEAEYLVKIANDHLQFTHDTAMAISILQRADETLASVQNSSVIEVRKAVTADILALQATPATDTTSLYLHINALDGQLEQLPLPVDPLQSNLYQAPVVEIPANAPWWKAGLLHTWATLHKFIIVRNTGTQTLPLVFPEEKLFLFQNLHAKLQTAMWAVLYSQQDVYQASLASVISWVQKYFVQDAPETKTILQNLEELQKINIKPADVNLDETLQLFHAIPEQIPQPQLTE